MMIRTGLLAWFLALGACGGADEAERGSADAGASDADTFDPALYDPGIGATPGAEDDGNHPIAVRRSDGKTDTVWIKVVSPPGDGPFPTVVYGHGFNVANLANCKPNGEKFWSERGDRLAEAGYLAVSIFYRNVGAGAPSLDEVSMRDMLFWDTGAMLSAARWARDYHRKGTDQVAFIGTSGGAWPALLAISEHPQVTPHQRDLDIRTSIMAAESTNMVGTVGRRWNSFGANPAGLDALVQGFDATLSVLRSSRVPTLTADMFEAGGKLREDLEHAMTPKGIALVKDVLVTEGQSLYDQQPTVFPACQGLVGVPPSCAETCVGQVFAWHLSQAGSVEAMLTTETFEALAYYDPPTALDPGPDSSNFVLAALRAISPVLWAEGPAHSERAMVLLSQNDSHYDSFTRDQLVDRLGTIGVQELAAPTITVDAMGGNCEHADYFDTSRPACGFDAIRNELAAAFAN